MSTCSLSRQRRNASLCANLCKSGLPSWVHILTDMWSTLAHFLETSVESCLVPKLLYVPLPKDMVWATMRSFSRLHGCVLAATVLLFYPPAFRMFRKRHE
jgi:hypothetical protein